MKVGEFLIGLLLALAAVLTVAFCVWISVIVYNYIILRPSSEPKELSVGSVITEPSRVAYPQPLGEATDE